MPSQNSDNASSGSKGYSVTSSGTNSQGNHYCSRDYGSGFYVLQQRQRRFDLHPWQVDATGVDSCLYRPSMGYGLV
ncbi:hypothetical protein PtrSN001A_002541 [Pyrenophora tritici-repentis]|nr:hypothetical protein PtrSN001A_002541 [Pyrenophora tritici-repentis]